MKNSYQHSHAADRPELLTMKEFQPDLLKLFEDVLSNGSSLRVRVTGRSMVPFLRGGEVLTIRQTPCQSLRTGDLILFKNTYDLPVLHRIIKKRRSDAGTFRFLTKGDAQLDFDEEIDGTKVLGKVRRIERSGRSGKVCNIDMNSNSRRGINYLIALIHFLKSQTYFLLSRAIAKIK